MKDVVCGDPSCAPGDGFYDCGKKERGVCLLYAPEEPIGK